MKADAPIKVKLVSGDFLEAKISPGAEGRLKIETPGVSPPVEVEPVKITPFNDIFVICPNFKFGLNCQFRNEAALGTALGGGWNLLGGILTESNNRPPPGVKDADNTYLLGLGVTF